MYRNWLSKDYLPVDHEELSDYVQPRPKVFYEKELDIPLVLFNEVLEHVDRIFKQKQVRALTLNGYMSVHVWTVWHTWLLLIRFWCVLCVL